jgi:hypothetical protein
MVVLSRILKLRGTVHETDVTIRIFWPVQEKSAWACRWEIDWPDRRRSNLARGSDGVQALVHALYTVGTEIYCSDEHKSGRLSWIEDRAGYGFPVPANIRDLLVGDDAKYL